MENLGTPTGDETIDPAEQIQHMTFKIVKDSESSPDIQLTSEQEARIKELIQEEVIDAGFELPPESTEITVLASENHEETGAVEIAVLATISDEEFSVSFDFKLT